MAKHKGIGVKHVLVGFGAAAAIGFALPVQDVSGASTVGDYSKGPACYRQAWSHDLLVKLDVPVTDANREALVAWSLAEGGHFANKAKNNLLNSNRPMKGSWKAIGLDSIQGYPSPKAGVEATAASINLPAFKGIRSALKQGSEPQTVINAAAAAPWAMSHYRGYGWSSLRSQARAALAAECAS